MELRFHSPYRYALLGLLTEIAIFLGVLALSAGLALLFASMV